MDEKCCFLPFHSPCRHMPTASEKLNDIHISQTSNAEFMEGSMICKIIERKESFLGLFIQV